ncbi:hypothetical protein BDN67DRAFT_1010835 [Paxillus ammoniavirescens]|nr:hypothetical protein BDN67DRAFT_1010835 [Paxillus ammoniavirescens]
MSPPSFAAPWNIETVAVHASLPALLPKQPRLTPFKGVLAIDPLASPPIRGNPSSHVVLAHAININFSPPSHPVPFRALLDFALVALLDLASEPVASSSNSTAHTAQSPVSSAEEPNDTWALYLKVQSLIQTVAGSWNLSAGKNDVHQIIYLLMELRQLKERLDNVMERRNHLHDTMGLIKLLERLYEE